MLILHAAALQIRLNEGRLKQSNPERIFKQYLQCASIHKLFCKRANLYQITIGIGHITGALPPRLCGGRKNRGSTIRERMLVFLVDISICGYVEFLFYRTIAFILLF